MKRFVCAALASAFFALSAPADSFAQASVFLGGGTTIPVSDYNDFAKVGWQGHGGVLAPVGEAGEATVVVGAEGYFGSNNHDTDGDKTNLYGGLALVGIQFGDPEEVSPGIYAGLGSMTHSFKSDLTPAFEGSDTSLAAGGGAGVSFPLGSIRGFVGGNFVTGFSDNSGTKYIGFGFSAVIPVGGNGM